jgi:hypothetical protein
MKIIVKMNMAVYKDSEVIDSFECDDENLQEHVQNCLLKYGTRIEFYVRPIVTIKNSITTPIKE